MRVLISSTHYAGHLRPLLPYGHSLRKLGHEVLVSAPGVGRVLVWFRQPLLLVVISLAVAALVTWTFWPESNRSRSLPSSAPIGAQQR